MDSARPLISVNVVSRIPARVGIRLSMFNTKKRNESMATKVTVTLVDDLDGTSEADETVTFGLDGAMWEIDLTNEHAAQLRDALAEYVAVARRASVGRRPAVSRAIGTGARSASTKEENAAIRAWATRNGFDVSDRGRIPASVIDAYRSREQDTAANPVPTVADDASKDQPTSTVTPEPTTLPVHMSEPPAIDKVNSTDHETEPPTAAAAVKPPRKRAAKPKAATSNTTPSNRRGTAKAKQPETA